MHLVVRWDWADAVSYWIQGDITEVLASDLQEALASGEPSRVQKNLSILQSSGGIFCNERRFSCKPSNKEMQAEIFGRALNQLSDASAQSLGGPRVRACLAQIPDCLSYIKGQKHRNQLVQCAVDDLLWLVKQDRFDDSAHYYSGVLPTEWEKLAQHQRLAVAFALRPHTTGFRCPDRGHMQDGWETCKEADLETVIDERIRATLELSVKVATRFRKRSHGAWNMRTNGPLSLAVLWAIESSSCHDKPSSQHLGWCAKERVTAEEASRLARVATIAFDRLCNDMPESKREELADRFREHLFEYASPAVCVLGARACRAFPALRGEKALDVVRHIIAKERNASQKGPGLVRLCTIASDFATVHVRPEALAELVLAGAYEVSVQDAFKVVEILCGADLAGGREGSAAERPALQLLLHVRDPQQAMGLVQKISKHADAGSRPATQSRARGVADRARFVRAIRWGAAEQSQRQFLPGLIAIRLGGIWLDSNIPNVNRLSHLSADDEGCTIAASDTPMADTDLVLLESILDFASQVIETSKPIEWNCLESHSDVLSHFHSHWQWAGKMCKAVTVDHVEAETKLAQQLYSDRQSIPLGFISFLVKGSDELAAQVYLGKLLCATPADKLRRFLPAADQAKRKSAAAERLGEWLSRTIRNNSSEQLKLKISGLMDSIKASTQPTFPECLGAQDMSRDSALQEALAVFMEDAAHPTVGTSGSDLIDDQARNILESYGEAQDPLRVPAIARKNAKTLLERVFAGEVEHDKVRLDKERFARSPTDVKREQKALVALLQADEPDDVKRFLELVLAEPRRLLGWAERVSDFLTDTLKVRDLPQALQEFKEIYSGPDKLAGLKFFSKGLAQDNKNISAQQDDGPSVQHMLCTFEKIFSSVPQGSWSQIDLLPELSPLVLLFREKFKDVKTLQRKMDALRWVSLLSSLAAPRRAPVIFYAAVTCMTPQPLVKGFVCPNVCQHSIKRNPKTQNPDSRRVRRCRCVSTIDQISSSSKFWMRPSHASTKSPTAKDTNKS